ncbi:hypothetical protein F4818DRAFT_165158 [Hypoxylon cercidicola]|nr:hypothetical protein F4818DRAFT_165158 [Hypoxylon cercidicola]
MITVSVSVVTGILVRVVAIVTVMVGVKVAGVVSVVVNVEAYEHVVFVRDLGLTSPIAVPTMDRVRGSGKFRDQAIQCRMLGRC